MDAETVYLFRHALLRDAAYQLQLPGDRARLHALAFEIIEQILGGRAPAPSFDDTGDSRAEPHFMDGMSHEIYLHALAAAVPEEAARLYLHRAAAYAERSHRLGEASGLWQQLAGLSEGFEKACALRRAGATLHASGQVNKSEPFLRQALAEAEKSGRAPLIATVLTDAANRSLNAGQLEPAEQYYEEALRIFRHLGDKRKEAIIIGNQAVLAMRRGRTHDVERLCNEASSVLADAGMDEHGGLLRTKASLHNNLGRSDLAGQFFNKALASYQAVGDRGAMCHTLLGLASLELDLGQFEAAGRHYQLAYAIQSELGNRGEAGLTLVYLANLVHTQNDLARAEQLYQQALELLRDTGHAVYLGVALGEQGAFYCATGKFDMAETILQEATTAHRNANSRRGLGNALCNLAAVYRATGRLELSRTTYDEALAIHRELRNRRMEGHTLCGLALCLLDLRSADQGRDVWLQGVAILTEIRDVAGLKEVSQNMRAACSLVGTRPFDE